MLSGVHIGGGCGPSGALEVAQVSKNLLAPKAVAPKAFGAVSPISQSAGHRTVPTASNRRSAIKNRKSKLKNLNFLPTHSRVRTHLYPHAYSLVLTCTHVYSHNSLI